MPTQNTPQKQAPNKSEKKKQKPRENDDWMTGQREPQAQQGEHGRDDLRNRPPSMNEETREAIGRDDVHADGEEQRGRFTEGEDAEDASYDNDSVEGSHVSDRSGPDDTRRS